MKSVDPGRSRPGDAAAYYRCHVFCCINERPEGHPRGCCKERGSVRLRNYMKARAKELGLDGVRINQSGCLDRCELGPVMVIYPEGIWYRYDTLEDVDEILQQHVIGGGRVERLLLRPEDGPK
ncbi:(2Fe-2S) ferredoxin domain-containing protein [Limibacillus halophilus]|uniref:(2Fe-2S) ferredoxin n=1 Tax=Limibacillus halophilus TaxID=1579333 RepID=A0A839SMA4_9PROT|nr:(2Fe-2S) ferredoxin domain-containing protein [Limibacillus halophilus]MBB3064027.1 (2Fe-2S) ferredoxin [Limibacillus halophilus]